VKNRAVEGPWQPSKQIFWLSFCILLAADAACPMSCANNNVDGDRKKKIAVKDVTKLATDGVCSCVTIVTLTLAVE
jgi:hypothetical protein